MTDLTILRPGLALLAAIVSPSCLCVSDFPAIGSAGSSSTTLSDSTETTSSTIVANDDVFIVLQSEAPPHAPTESLLDNDDSSAAGIARASSDTTEQGWGITVNENGSLSYDREAFFWGQDGFQYTAELDGITSTAEVHLLVRPVEILLADVARGYGGVTIAGELFGNEAGASASGIGDFNGDGFDDVVIGAPAFAIGGADAGRCYVVFGAPEPRSIELQRLVEDEHGIIINGEDTGDRACHSVAGIGDFDGDGKSDIIIGAPNAGPSNNGRAYVVFGRAELDPVELADVADGGARGFLIEGESAQDDLGYDVALAGDVNGDQYPDLLVGARVGSGPAGATGRAYVVLGKEDMGSVDLAEVAASGAGGFVIVGEAPGDRAGAALAGAVDINGDGTDDVILGASGADFAGEQSGRAYVVFGKPDTASVELADVANGDGGFAIDGSMAGDQAGISVSALPDVNGDGRDEVVVGIDRGAGEFGAAYVVYGKDDDITVLLSDMGTEQGYELAAGERGDGAGSVVATVGDFDGDGVDDLGVAAPTASHDGVPETTAAGAVYVVYGGGAMSSVVLGDLADGNEGFLVFGEESGDAAGLALGTAGDFNGDGIGDLLIGAPDAGTTGRAYVVFGVPSQFEPQ